MKFGTWHPKNRKWSPDSILEIVFSGATKLWYLAIFPGLLEFLNYFPFRNGLNIRSNLESRQLFLRGNVPFSTKPTSSIE